MFKTKTIIRPLCLYLLQMIVTEGQVAKSPAVGTQDIDLIGRVDFKYHKNLTKNHCNNT